MEKVKEKRGNVLRIHCDVIGDVISDVTACESGFNLLPS